MPAPPSNEDGHNIALLLVGVTVLAIVIIIVLTVTAILSGPPM